MNIEVNILVKSVRKVKNRDMHKVVVHATTETGFKIGKNIITNYYKQFLVCGSRNEAQGRLAMHLRNITQKATVVNIPA